MAEETTPAPEKKPDGKTFTQEDVDRVVEQRLGRERQKFADYDDLKAKAQRADELEQAQSSDLEKAVKRAEKAERERDEAITAKDQAVTTANQNLTKAAVVAEASKRGVIDADAAFQLLPKDKVTVGDDGQVTGVDEALNTLLEERAWLVGNAGPGPGDGGARTPAPGGNGGDPEEAHSQFLKTLFGGS